MNTDGYLTWLDELPIKRPPKRDFQDKLTIKDNQLYIRKYGRLFKVTAYFARPDDPKGNVNATNNYLASEQGKGQGVIYSTKDDLMIVIADNNDKGEVWLSKIKKKRYIGCCVQLPGKFVTDIVNKSRDITINTLLKHVDKQDVKDLFPFYAWEKGENKGLKLEDDWHVQYGKSIVNKKVYYFIKHSGIEYIWQ